MLHELLASKIICTWSVMCFLWNCVLMTPAGQMHQTHLSSMEPNGFLSAAFVSFRVNCQLFDCLLEKCIGEISKDFLACHL